MPAPAQRVSTPEAAIDGDIAAWVREEFGAFITERINPGTQERDQTGQCVPKEIIRQAGELGLISLSLPQQMGGRALSTATWGRVLEELGVLCEDFSFLLMLGTRIGVSKAIHESGRPELIEQYAVPMAKGQLQGCFAYSDGGDAFALNTQMQRTPEGWVVNGGKYMVTGATTGDVFMTYGSAPNGDVVVLLIERGDPGVEVTPIATMGARSAGLGCVEYRNVLVPESRVLTSVDGVSHSQRFLGRRATLVAAPLGMARRLLADCIDTLERRRRFGRPLTDMETVQAALGRMRIAIDSSRAVLHDAFARLDDPSAPAPLISSVAKYFVSEQLQQVARTAQYLLGGDGYASGANFERYARDFAAFIAGAGTQYTLEVNIGVLSINHNGDAWRSK